METIRVMLVDDHDVVRAGLKAYLETQDGILVVAEADSGEAAIHTMQEARPQVVVMDITMPGMDGLEATRRLKELYPECKVLALTVHADQQYFFEMLSAGAVGYVTKQVAAEELVAAVRAVAHGHVYLQPALAVWLLDDYRRLLAQLPAEGHNGTGMDNPDQSLEVLSKRELQVLEAVAEGYTTAQIGEQLGISPKTVARHRERMLKKLNLHSSTALVSFAIRSGLIDLNGTG
jgi:two-component system, NarL family, response regulator NreC